MRRPRGSGGLKDWISKTTEGNGDPILDAVANISNLQAANPGQHRTDAFSYNPKISKMRFFVGYSFSELSADVAL